jgi:spermidine/putrescine transport system permease protein
VKTPGRGVAGAVEASTRTVATARSETSEGVRPPLRTSRRRWTYFTLPVYSALAILYLLIPISIMVLYSFNQSHSHLPNVTFNWQGFTLQWYREWNQIPGLTAAFFLSLKLAFSSAIVSTAMGTLLALALVRYRFRGKTVVDQVMFANIAAPEIVLGAALLGLFITLNFPKGFTTLIIAHVMFSIAYVTITVRARLAGFDLTVEQAAQDLGATPWVTFWKITFPLIFPAILAGSLLAFALSIDDFVISYFVAGSRETFPIWIYGAVKVGTPPQVFVLGTLIFTVGVLIAGSSLVFQGRKAKTVPPVSTPSVDG